MSHAAPKLLGECHTVKWRIVIHRNSCFRSLLHKTNMITLNLLCTSSLIKNTAVVNASSLNLHRSSMPETSTRLHKRCHSFVMEIPLSCDFDPLNNGLTGLAVGNARFRGRVSKTDLFQPRDMI